jgi:HK97 family phage portal protein
MLLTSFLRGNGRGFWAATPENPRFNLNDPAAWDALGAQPAASGVRVNRQTALQFSPYYRALSLISGAFAKLPLSVYRRQGKGKQVDSEHAAQRLLRWKPNKEQTAFLWKRTMAVHSLAEGNGYSYIFRRGDGTPRELIGLDPVKTFPVRENGRLWYVTEVNADKRKLVPEDVLHFPGLSWDGMMGLSLTECAKESLGMGMGGQRYGSTFFKNAGRPAVTLEHPMKLEDKVKNALREGWERMHTGLDNAHRTAILDGGLKANVLSVNARDAQVLELLSFNLIDLANFFDLPPHKLGNRDAASFASLEQENQAFLDDGLDPRLITFEEQCWDKLLTEEQKDADSHVIVFDRKALIRANMQTRSAYFRTALGGRPWMTQNEVREEEGLNPLTTTEADQVLDPLNMGQGGAKNDPKDPAKSSVDEGAANVTRAAAAAMLEDSIERMVRRVGVHAGQLDKACKSSSAYMAWLKSLEGQHLPVFDDATSRLDAACRRLHYRGGEYDTIADWLLYRISKEFGDLADSTTLAALPLTAKALVEDLVIRLPEEAVLIFLGGAK